MREEKKHITEEYVQRLNASPFFLLVDYRGLTVSQFMDLRHRLGQVEARILVVKNSLLRRAAQTAAARDLNGDLAGQMALVTGRQEITGAAKVIKTFFKEFDRPQFRLGFLGERRLDAEELSALADLPSLPVLRAQLLGVLQGPARQLVRLIQTPGSQLARVLKARVDKGN